MLFHQAQPPGNYYVLSFFCTITFFGDKLHVLFSQSDYDFITSVSACLWKHQLWVHLFQVVMMGRKVKQGENYSHL